MIDVSKLAGLTREQKLALIAADVRSEAGKAAAAKAVATKLARGQDPKEAARKAAATKLAKATAQAELMLAEIEAAEKATQVKGKGKGSK